jgi:hypothetical protein
MVIVIGLVAAVAASLLLTVTLRLRMRSRSPEERRSIADRWERGLSAMGKAEGGGWSPRRRG